VVVIREQAPRENLEIVPLLEVSEKIEELDRFLGIREDLLAPRKPVYTWYSPPSMRTRGALGISDPPVGQPTTRSSESSDLAPMLQA
jgi:hypothetical protein